MPGAIYKDAGKVKAPSKPPLCVQCSTLCVPAPAPPPPPPLPLSPSAFCANEFVYFVKCQLLCWLTGQDKGDIRQGVKRSSHSSSRWSKSQSRRSRRNSRSLTLAAVSGGVCRWSCVVCTLRLMKVSMMCTTWRMRDAMQMGLLQPHNKNKKKRARIYVTVEIY